MASSSTSSTKTRHIAISPEEILNIAPANRQVQRIKPNTPGRNERDYLILVYYNNDEHEWNGNQIAVCYYHRVWGKLRYDHKGLHPLAGQEYPEIHQYDLVPSTHHHSDTKESDDGKGKGKGVN